VAETVRDGAQLLNGEHEQLLGLFSQLCDALRRSSSEESLALVTQLSAAFLEHARHEEDIMLSIGYPEASGHRWQHEVLTADLQSIVQMIAGGPTRNAEEIVGSLRTIIVDHMAHTDSELMRFCESRGLPDRTLRCRQESGASRE
jgi:hemerythrin-like metal-binding protein